MCTEASLQVQSPPVAPYSTSSGLIQRVGDSASTFVPISSNTASLSFLAAGQESTLMTVGDLQLSNQIQVTEREFGR